MFKLLFCSFLCIVSCLDPCLAEREDENQRNKKVKHEAYIITQRYPRNNSSVKSIVKRRHSRK